MSRKPVRPNAIPRRGGRLRHAESSMSVDEMGVDSLNSVVVKPAQQVALTETELNEDITKILKADNPSAPSNIVRFSFKDGCYKSLPTVEQCHVHFDMAGCTIHKDSEEGRRQRQAAAARKQVDEDEAAVAEARQSAGAVGGVATASVSTSTSAGLRNQFDFSERASQTFNNPRRTTATMTEPPPRIDFGGTVTQWAIVDAYVEDQKKRAATDAKAAAAKKKAAGRATDDSEAAPPKKSQKSPPARDSFMHSDEMCRSVRVLERMVNQNSFRDVALDYKYWNDPHDDFRNSGSLLPLWRFSSTKAKKRTVTAVAWNKKYRDLFAVGYGSYDFMKPRSGVVACFSLKNPSHAEWSLTLDSGVMCVDWHPQRPSLIAVGLYDGSVVVHDVTRPGNTPLFRSTTHTGKHSDAVWDIRWQGDDLASNLNFFAVSGDGRVTAWTIVKTELQHSTVMHLKATSADAGADGDAGDADDGGLDDDAVGGLACGTCFDFAPDSAHLFVVGTEEGRIHKCSKSYNSRFLATYAGHSMAVYAVRWSPFDSRVFLSASEDWSVRVWDHRHSRAVMSFDLGAPVADVSWSNVSSTVFAAATADGRVVVYDLAQSKHEPVCSQQIVSKARLTHVSFNPNTSVILVSDDRGNVHCLKTSPNLRKASTATASVSKTSNSSSKAGAAKKKVSSRPSASRRLAGSSRKLTKPAATPDTSASTSSDPTADERAQQRAKLSALLSIAHKAEGFV